MFSYNTCRLHYAKCKWKLLIQLPYTSCYWRGLFNVFDYWTPVAAAGLLLHWSTLGSHHNAPTAAHCLVLSASGWWMRGYNVSPTHFTPTRNIFYVTLSVYLSPPEWRIPEPHWSPEEGPEKFMRTDMKKRERERKKTVRMQNSRLVGDRRTWQIFMANHSGVRWMAYKEHAELCTL